MATFGSTKSVMINFLYFLFLMDINKRSLVCDVWNVVINSKYAIILAAVKQFGFFKRGPTDVVNMGKVCVDIR